MSSDNRGNEQFVRWDPPWSGFLQAYQLIVGGQNTDLLNRFHETGSQDKNTGFVSLRDVRTSFPQPDADGSP